MALKQQTAVKSCAILKPMWDLLCFVFNKAEPKHHCFFFSDPRFFGGTYDFITFFFNVHKYFSMMPEPARGHRTWNHICRTWHPQADRDPLCTGCTNRMSSTTCYVTPAAHEIVLFSWSDSGAHVEHRTAGNLTSYIFQQLHVKCTSFVSRPHCTKVLEPKKKKKKLGKRLRQYVREEIVEGFPKTIGPYTQLAYLPVKTHMYVLWG